jgi:hypothetical protein
MNMRQIVAETSMGTLHKISAVGDSYTVFSSGKIVEGISKRIKNPGSETRLGLPLEGATLLPLTIMKSSGTKAQSFKKLATKSYGHFVPLCLCAFY